ncbi:MAG: hypothetical protein ACI9OE_000510 [Mariniflexile sp.]|jgi:hypothetical protein
MIYENRILNQGSVFLLTLKTKSNILITTRAEIIKSAFILIGFVIN